MNTAAALFCQTGGRRKLVRWRWAQVAATLVGLSVASVTWAVPPEPPVWQSELDALRLSEATIALLPPARAAEAADADRRLDELFRRLAARQPRVAAVRKAAGDHFWRTGQNQAATAEWEAAQELTPNDADTAEALGSARLQAGQTRLAYEQFRRAAGARPNVARYHFELGNILYLFRHQLAGLPSVPDEAVARREALVELRRARDLAPGNKEFAQGYAETFYDVPDPDWNEALQAWTTVRTLSDDAPDFALGHLARISLRLGKPDEAERYLAMIHDPRFATLQAKLRRQAAELREAGADRSH